MAHPFGHQVSWRAACAASRLRPPLGHQTTFHGAVGAAADHPLWVTTPPAKGARPARRLEVQRLSKPFKLPERPTQQARLQRAPDDGSVGCFGSKGWPSTTAEAMSMSFRFAERACWRGMSKAVASSTECRSMRIPFARSVTARRPKAPSRSLYSASDAGRCRSSSASPLGPRR